MAESADILVFGPHPDDAELGCGGMLLKMHAKGHTSAIIDLSEGEMASGGTPEERYAEAEAARRILGVAFRENMKLPDCGIEDTFENRCKAAQLVRKYRADVVFAPYYAAEPPGRGLGHNDHYKSGQIVSHGCNYAHLKNLPIDGEPFTVKAIFYYAFPRYMQPTFVVNFTEHFDTFMEAIRVHYSQFGHIEDEELKNLMGGDNPLDPYFRMPAFDAGTFGYAQPFLTERPLVLEDPVAMVKQQPSISQFVDDLRKRRAANQS